MVKVQVREDDDVDVVVAQSSLSQVLQQDMLGLLDAKSVLELGLEECANTGLQEDISPFFLDQQGPASQVDPVAVVWRCPPLPKGTGSVAEHGAPIELLRIAEDAGEVTCHGVDLTCAAAPIGWGAGGWTNLGELPAGTLAL